MATILILASGVLVVFLATFRDKNIFDMLTDFVIFAESIFYLLAVLAVLVLRHTRPDWDRPYRTWGYPVVPIAYVLFYFWFLSQVYLGKPFEAKMGLLLIGLGLPVYFAYQYWSGGRKRGENDQ
jgi:APA family basic amino acid/polyamine antiporter